MNKISKKIVALATMAAFVLTLVPVAAFAQPTDSYVETAKANLSVNLPTDGRDAEADVVVNIDTEDLSHNVLVWLEKDDAVYTYATAKAASGESATVTQGIQGWRGAAVIPANNATPQDPSVAITFSIPDAGEYTVHAGVDLNGNLTTGDYESLAKFAVGDKGNTLNVVDKSEVTAIDLTPEYWNNELTWNADNTYDLDLIDDDFVANNNDVYDIEGVAYVDKANNVVAANKVITLTNGNSKVLTFVGTDADEETEGFQVVTDRNGNFSFGFTMNDNRNVPITITAGDVKYVLNVIKETTRAYDIDTVEDGGYVLAGDSAEWNNWSAVDENNENRAVLSDAVTFSVTDVTGDPVGQEDMTAEPATDADIAQHFRYMSVVGPEDSTLDTYDLTLEDLNDGTYTLVYTGDSEADREADLIPGKYTVNVSLLSGDNAKAVFYVEDYGTTQDLVLNMTATDASTAIGGAIGDGETRVVDITDEVTLGQLVGINPQYVDENGITLNAPADDVSFGGGGEAVVDTRITNDSFVTKADVKANEALIGTTIEVVASSQAVNKTVWAELTVVDSYNALGLEFDPTEGPVGEDNDVTVSVVKEDGTRAQVEGTIVSAYVADQSNEDAVVTVDGLNSDVTNGRGTITVYASDATTADIVVAVKDDTNSGLYAATLEYNAGNVDITAHHEVTMTIGSSQYVVDKQLFEMDAAPYVDNAWRTMIPIRALAEAFDATVTYDNDDRTVTIEYNDQTIVMTIGEDTYTVNDEEMTMDTEPVIQGDRTYVPIRFVAEAMGFTVTPLYNANSSTASVVFQS